MAKAYKRMPNGWRALLGLEASDIPDLSATQITSDELTHERLPTGGVQFENLASTLLAYLIEAAEQAFEAAGVAASEDRASEYYPETVERRANEYYP